MEKRLYSLTEFCNYTGFGKTKARRLAKQHENDFTVRLGNKIFIDIKGFEDYMEKCKSFGISL